MSHLSQTSRLDVLYFHPSGCPCGCGGTLKSQITSHLATFPVHQLTAASRRTLINQAIRDIYEGSTTAEIHQSIFDIYSSNYYAAVTSVYGTEDSEEAQHYKINLSQLAAAKSFRITAELKFMRHDPVNKTIHEWDDYKERADRIIKKYNRYQTAEYNTIVARCRTAKQFARFRERADMLPNIRWLATVSMHPRELHRHFAELPLILPVDHPFWLDNQPGNLYNCKCDWRQTTDPATPEDQLPESVPSNEGLEGNPAVTGKIITFKHPYCQYLPHKHIPDTGILLAPDSIAYLKRQYEGINYLLHYNAQDEFNATGRAFLPALIKAGYKDFRFLPTIRKNEPELRKRYFGKYSESNKCADIYADRLYVELKYARSGKKMRRNIIDHIGDAAKKADAVLVKIGSPLSENDLQKKAHPQKLWG